MCVFSSSDSLLVSVAYFSKSTIIKLPSISSDILMVVSFFSENENRSGWIEKQKVFDLKLIITCVSLQERIIWLEYI